MLQQGNSITVGLLGSAVGALLAASDETVTVSADAEITAELAITITDSSTPSSIPFGTEIRPLGSIFWNADLPLYHICLLFPFCCAQCHHLYTASTCIGFSLDVEIHMVS